MGNFLVFAVLALLAIGAAVAMVTSRNAIHSALYLIGVMAILAVYYILLNAPFIAMVQVAVYAGAIMVLFLFVIMLLGAEQLGGITAGSRRQVVLALLLGVVLLAVLGFTVVGGTGMAAASGELIEAGPTAVGLELFESYVFPFEVVGVLVLRTKERSRRE
jgi:NADH-quinone oxidoreductase subunit J